MRDRDAKNSGFSFLVYYNVCAGALHYYAALHGPSCSWLSHN